MGNRKPQVLKRMLSTTRTTVLSRERSLRIQYSCREKRDVIFSKWPIAGNPTESANWSTVIIRQSSIQSLNTRRKWLAASREKNSAMRRTTWTRAVRSRLTVSSQLCYCNTVLIISASGFSTDASTPCTSC